jgi:hypothetical protein
MSSTPAQQLGSMAPLAGDRALAIAQADALSAYRDLAAYRIQLVLEADGWHVDYELKNPRHKGVGRIMSSTPPPGRSSRSDTSSEGPHGVA